jgi:hypothetical protein
LGRKVGKVNKRLQSIIEWTIAAILLVTAVYPFIYYGSFSALKAYQKSEQSYHYGPSEILEVIDFPKGRIFLGKYDKWFSAHTIKKGLIRWYPGGDPGGYPIKENEQISSTWSGSRISDDYYLYKVYGYVNNSDITTVTLEVEWIKEDKTENKVLEYKLKDHRGFIFYWNENETKYKLETLRGLDTNGNILYEQDYQ